MKTIEPIQTHKADISPITRSGLRQGLGEALVAAEKAQCQLAVLQGVYRNIFSKFPELSGDMQEAFDRADEALLALAALTNRAYIID